MEPQEFIQRFAQDFATVEEFREEFAAWFRRNPTYKEEVSFEEVKQGARARA